ncbi:MAG TPA: phasin family protein [Ramlibacter sp.]|nr:phasin family protein [Ramlibacter sp.]
MSTKTRVARRPVAAASQGKVSGFDFLADFGREQLAVMMDASAAMFRGFETMRTIQQQAAQQASARHETAANKMRGNCDAIDLMTIPFGLLQENLQSATRYWQELAAAALETQTEMMGCASHLINTDAAIETASAVEALDAVPGITQLFPRPAAASRARS